jgi:hypothetical protein
MLGYPGTRFCDQVAARGWSYEQAARAFLLDEQTLRSWIRRVDEEGERALIQIAEPVNRFPDFVRYLVKQLKALLPTMGKVRLAQLLARTGVGRIGREPEPLPEDATGHGRAPALRHRQPSREGAARSSVSLWATWKAEGICPSSSCVALPDRKKRYLRIRSPRWSGAPDPVSPDGLACQKSRIPFPCAANPHSEQPNPTRIGGLNSVDQFTGQYGPRFMRSAVRCARSRQH